MANFPSSPRTFSHVSVTVDDEVFYLLDVAACIIALPVSFACPLNLFFALCHLQTRVSGIALPSSPSISTHEQSPRMIPSRTLTHDHMYFSFIQERKGSSSQWLSDTMQVSILTIDPMCDSKAHRILTQIWLLISLLVGT